MGDLWCTFLLILSKVTLLLPITILLRNEIHGNSLPLRNLTLLGNEKSYFLIFCPTYAVSFFLWGTEYEDGYKVGFPGGSEVKASACNVGDLGSIPESGRSPGGGHGNPLQYSCLRPWRLKESDTTKVT